MVGRDVGAVPFRMGWLSGKLVMRTFFHRVLTIRTPIGRKLRPKMMHSATPLIRTKHADLLEAGVDMQLQRIAGVRDGLPVLEDGRVLDVKNVIWCTGYHAGHSWIDLPIFGEDGDPQHEAGVVTKEPGLYFVGLQFLYSMSSSMVHGVGRDAARIASAAAARATSVQQRAA
jgi:putative flavoprotein involved in K+ transport